MASLNVRRNRHNLRNVIQNRPCRGGFRSTSYARLVCGNTNLWNTFLVDKVLPLKTKRLSKRKPRKKKAILFYRNDFHEADREDVEAIERVWRSLVRRGVIV